VTLVNAAIFGIAIGLRNSDNTILWTLIGLFYVFEFLFVGGIYLGVRHMRKKQNKLKKVLFDKHEQLENNFFVRLNEIAGNLFMEFSIEAQKLFEETKKEFLDCRFSMFILTESFSIFEHLSQLEE